MQMKSKKYRVVGLARKPYTLPWSFLDNLPRQSVLFITVSGVKHSTLKLQIAVMPQWIQILHSGTTHWLLASKGFDSKE